VYFVPFVVKNFFIMQPLTSTDPETKSPDLAAGDVAKTNLTAILHQHGTESVRSL